MTHGLLSEPGILLRMVVPDPSDTAAVDGEPPAVLAKGSTWRTGRTALLAALWAVACVGCGLGAASARFALAQMSAPVAFDWWPFVAAGAGGAIVAGCVGQRPRGRWAIGMLTALALGVTGLLEAMPRSGALFFAAASPIWPCAGLLGQAVGLGLVLGARMVRGEAPGGAGWLSNFLSTGLAALAAAGAALSWAWLESTLRGFAGVGTQAFLLAALVVVMWSASVDGARPTLVGARLARPTLSWWLAWPALGWLLWVAAPATLWGRIGAPEVGVFAAAVAASLWAMACRATGLALGVGLAAAVLPHFVAPPAAGWQPAGEILLARAGRATAVYDRATQSMQLREGGQLVDAAGPDCPAAALAATLAHTGLAIGDRGLVLGQGVGRLPELLLQAGLHEVEVVDARPAALALLRRLAADGPVAAPDAEAATPPPRIRTHAIGWRPFLAGLPDASRQLVVLGEPLRTLSLQVTRETQAELRRVVGNGWVLQTLSLAGSPGEAGRALLAAAVLAHPWNGLFAVGDGAVLVSAGSAPSWAAETPAWPTARLAATFDDEAAWLAHAAHVGSHADLRRACLGTVVSAASPFVVADDALPGAVAHVTQASGPGLLPLCRTLLQALPPISSAAPSLLLYWQTKQDELQAAAQQLRALGGDREAMAQAQLIAAKFLPMGAPSAILQAALGLPAADGVTLREPAAASLCAQAIDPTFFDDRPPVCAELPRPRQSQGELEDLAYLPPLARLAEVCVGDLPLAVALRARFGSRCSRALLALLAIGPLSAEQTQALRQLADPFVLEQAGLCLARRGAVPELLSLWRGDLPLPTALAEFVHGNVEQRRWLVTALNGRRDPSICGVLAEFLVAPEAELRQLAGLALKSAVGERVPYDPDWPSSALNEAADRCRALHNRSP